MYFPTRRGVQSKESDFLKLLDAFVLSGAPKVKKRAVH
jgi:hypothetical protein